MSLVTAVVLAAGLGTRMKSSKPKVMHPIAHRPMIRHIIDMLETVSQQSRRDLKIITVVGPDMPSLEAAVAPHATVIQHERRGTGHAVQMAQPHLPTEGVVLILVGDAPLLRAETVQALLEAHQTNTSSVLVGSFRPPVATGFGRILHGADGTVRRIIEEKDLAPDQKAIPLCNSGFFVVAAEALPKLLAQLTPNNAQGEFYLTDIVEHAVAAGLSVRELEIPAEDVLAVNSRAEQAVVERIAQERYRAAAMANGATLLDPQTVYFAADTKLGRDVIVGPNVVFGPGVTVGDNVTIHAFSHLEGASVAAGAIIGPYARLRPGAEIGEGAHIGNFVEVKNATLGAGAKANHLTYLGDADIGAGTNVGAGTITCNYDGINKHRTIVGAGAFIGSNTALVAPVTVGDGALVGAGSTITKDVPADAIAVVRGPLTQKEGAAARFRDSRRAMKAKKKD
ncbi:bifunctional UDP-N-acetylglucosamine diphosphorylase/glucosamine-1-phosphate N-acetyltransferase GlmU [Elstera sp.]|jgi:bifunctional UDP-N-acetylglucosamine pyrophosphorylase/glucosamine-1-phosphate N-acetyltransferase|uniref:bifunctional UDP-N-acetylglucosamine diphosphorylase/glucosamine-1-phosphate N-acetyltransferase GlmU n=1 Tax=Elstera sp. TaxID=1916664 RepID=UPI0037C0B1E8